MNSKKIIIIGLVLGFVVALGAVLMREISREEEKLASSISGRAEVTEQLFRTGMADIRREDRAAVFLIDPKTKEPAAMKILSPFIPPAAFDVGQENSRLELKGEYILVLITDKDGELFRPSPGEVYGISTEPVALGSQNVVFIVDQPFRGGLMNNAGKVHAQAQMASNPQESTAPQEFSISGTIDVTPDMKSHLEQSDRLIVLLFDPQSGRPAANIIIPEAKLPQKFSISVSSAVAEANGGKGYYLRVVTDKNNNPFGSAPGELAGRSTETIALGTKDLKFILNTPYTR